MIPTLNSYRIYIYPNSVSLYLKSNESIIISNDGWEILKHCDGTKTIDMIHTLLNIETEISKEDLIKFISIAHKKNIIKFIDNFKKEHTKIFGNESSIPPQICSIELTDSCNLECKYCYGEFKRGEGKFWNIEDIKLLFDNLSKIGVIALELTGGEPLLHPNFKEILEIALCKFEVINILSNGVLFDDEVINIIKEHKHRVAIQISIDGCSEETNFKVRRVKNTFNKTMNTLKRFREGNVFCNTVYMITEENKHEIPDICELFRKEKLTNLLLSKAAPFGRGCDHKDCLVNKDDETTNMIKKMLEKYPDIFSKKHYQQQQWYEDAKDMTKFTISNCGTGWKAVSITSNGDVRSCPLLGEVGKMGNIFKQDICEITNSDKSRFYLNFSKKHEEKICHNCEYEYYCAMCITRIYVANLQRIRNGIDLCEIAKRNEMDKYCDFGSNSINFKFTI